jgi:predicted DNA-binding protein YlxM (UPF0122 family)
MDRELALKLKADYESGLSIQEVGDKNGIAKSTVEYNLHKVNTKKRRPGLQKKKKEKIVMKYKHKPTPERRKKAHNIIHMITAEKDIWGVYEEGS